VIEVHGLTKRYGQITAVDQLSFDVRPGVVTGFLGPNGSGKSTTMRLILGLDAADHGTVKVAGRGYHDLRYPLREVGALLEAKAFHPGRSARAHLQALAASNAIAPSRVDATLHLVGLQAAANRRAGQFSLGMAQRLGIATALLGDPPILIFDEPVSGLDPEGIRWIGNLMKSLAAEGRTVFGSSHLIAEMALPQRRRDQQHPGRRGPRVSAVRGARRAGDDQRVLLRDDQGHAGRDPQAPAGAGGQGRRLGHDRARRR
jgi:ABC-2 type transport system ATP-binding protein